MRLSPGARLGPFEIVAPLGAGGMGEVYRARDTRLGRDVALKVLPEELSQSPDRLARFEREARTVAGLTHPNIVTLHSIEEHGAIKFLVLELVEGRDLTSLVSKAGLPMAQVLDVVVPLAEALVAAHERGVVHRDLKPANVMLSRDGRVKVLDFGLAKPVEANSHATMAATISEVGQVLGTAAYMAPEQIRGDVVDARTDLFAFGVLVYELATGERPFRGESAADITSSILRDTPAPLTSLRAGLPSDLERIVDRCLAKNPRERFQTALDVLTELKRIGKAPRTKPQDEKVVSIAVLPFANRSANADDEYFAEGLADELLSVLGRIRGLRVATRTATARFKGTVEDPQSIGRALNVETILEGSVRRSGNRVRIAVQLAKVADGYRIWSESYDRMLDDVFAVQDDIAQSVVKELRIALLGEAGDSDASRDAKAEVVQAVRGRTENPEAHRLTLEARVLQRQRTPEAMEMAYVRFKRALELDPSYAFAYTNLANLHMNRMDSEGDPKARADELARMHEAVDRALELAPEDAETHALRSQVALKIEMNWKKANEAARRAMELEPENLTVLRVAAMVAGSRGTTAEAEELSRRLAALDPLQANVYTSLAMRCQESGRFGEAIDLARKAIALGGGFGAQSTLAASLAELGQWEEALTAAKQESIEGLSLYAQADVFLKMDRPEEASRILERLVERHSHEASSQIAELMAGLGRFDEAFDWIERAIRELDGGLMESLLVQRYFLPMHADRRWTALLKRLHFED